MFRHGDIGQYQNGKRFAFQRMIHLDFCERRFLNGKSRERFDRVIEMHLLTVLGFVASIAGLVLAIVFRIRDKRNHEMKESNRQAKG